MFFPISIFQTLSDKKLEGSVDVTNETDHVNHTDSLFGVKATNKNSKCQQDVMHFELSIVNSSQIKK